VNDSVVHGKKSAMTIILFKNDDFDHFTEQKVIRPSQSGLGRKLTRVKIMQLVK